MVTAETVEKGSVNRSFPGNNDGSLGERIADIIFTTILKTNPRIVLDLHNDWIKLMPYALIDPDCDPKFSDVNRTSELFASTTGLLVVRDTEELHKSLCVCQHKHNIPALTLELGEPNIIEI